MNQGTNNTSHSNHPVAESNHGAFVSGHTNTNTNPFATDMRGEFTSNFGTNTNAVSQIFKEGNFSSGSNTRLIVIGLGVLLLGVAAAYFLLREKEDPFKDVAEQVENPVSDVAAEGEAKTEGEAAPAEGEGAAATTAESTEAAPAEAAAAATGSLNLLTPANGDSRAYDETMGPALFTWEGAGGTIAFSRSSNMSPVYMKTTVSGNTYAFHNPYPGTWYWQVSTAEGGVSEIRSFQVSPAVPRNISVKEPASGASLSGNGGVVSWTGDSKIAFYRVELAGPNGWANPMYKFSTSGESISMQGVNPGSYQLRVGAFSEVSGRWEYTQPMTVTVQ